MHPPEKPIGSMGGLTIGKAPEEVKREVVS
jgi:hypothetical protein